MTAKRTTGDTSHPDGVQGEDIQAAATTREAKGSVHEAIGKLIGDDAARDRGSAEKRAGAAAASTPPLPPRR